MKVENETLNPLYRSILIGLYVIAFGLIFLGLIALKPEWKVLFFPKESNTISTIQIKQNITKIQEKFGDKKFSPISKNQEKEAKSTSENQDSISTKKEELLKIDSLQNSIQIQYPDGNTQALHLFFRSLQNLENQENQLYRVLHYGDSQLEGDRITATLRKNL
ncbi:MAG: hypothetical protein ACK40K_05045, partial [Raineya sp.]